MQRVLARPEGGSRDNKGEVEEPAGVNFQQQAIRAEFPGGLAGGSPARVFLIL